MKVGREIFVPINIFFVLLDRFRPLSFKKYIKLSFTVSFIVILTVFNFTDFINMKNSYSTAFIFVL